MTDFTVGDKRFMLSIDRDMRECEIFVFTIRYIGGEVANCDTHKVISDFYTYESFTFDYLDRYTHEDMITAYVQTAKSFEDQLNELINREAGLHRLMLTEVHPRFAKEDIETSTIAFMKILDDLCAKSENLFAIYDLVAKRHI